MQWKYGSRGFKLNPRYGTQRFGFVGFGIVVKDLGVLSSATDFAHLAISLSLLNSQFDKWVLYMGVLVLVH